MPAECEDEEVQRIFHGERVQTEEPTREAVVNGETSQAVGGGADDDEDALLSYRMRAINAGICSLLSCFIRCHLHEEMFSTYIHIRAFVNDEIHERLTE